MKLYFDESYSLTTILKEIKSTLEKTEILEVEIKLLKQSYPPLKQWMDCAESLQCEFSLKHFEEHVSIQFKLTKVVLLKFGEVDAAEKYGSQGKYISDKKCYEPTFIFDLWKCLDFIQINKDHRILDLGCNDGSVYSLIKAYNQNIFNSLNLTGLDYSMSAIEKAKKVYGQEFEFYVHDLNESYLIKDKMNVLISFNTLQCTTLDGKKVFRKFYQDNLLEDGSVLLCFPNCRHSENELFYGAKTKNYRANDMSLVLKDVMYYKKYLQQHGYRVWLTGKYYIFLAAIKINSRT